MPTAQVAASEYAEDSPLLISLADVAQLARVRRPVVSMWRSRFATGPHAFPAPISASGASVSFDVDEVAEWLVTTQHGNNPDAQTDAALWSTPQGTRFADDVAVDELSALIALHAEVGALVELSGARLVEEARRIDPGDAVLRREVEAHTRRPEMSTRYVDRIVDATYGPADAARFVAQRARWARRAASDLVPSAESLTVELVLELVRAASTGSAEHASAVVVHGAPASVTVQLGLRLDPDTTLIAADADSGEVRRARRLLWLEGLRLEGHTPDAERTARAAVHLVCLSDDGRGADALLAAVDEIVLGLGGNDAAVLIGSARHLVHALPPAADRRRSDLLRTGRVRAIALLPAGLWESAPREALAVWVLAAPVGAVPRDQRSTMVADLTDTALTDAARSDLVGDIWASVGSGRDVRSRAFRFGRFVRTSRLLAAQGSLIGPVVAPARSDGASLPARLDAAAARLPAHVGTPATRPTDMPARALSPLTIPELAEHGHVRLYPGTRLFEDLVGDSGLIVVGAQELADSSVIGVRRVPQLAFAAAHPRAGLTRPGDVVFCTAPAPAAWVDRDGSSVVVYPARVLRITPADPGGLVPEVVAADIRRAGTGSWRRWMLRRVAPSAAGALGGALSQLEATRAELLDTVAHLEEYTRLLTAGVVAGTVSVAGQRPAHDTPRFPPSPTGREAESHR